MFKILMTFVVLQLLTSYGHASSLRCESLFRAQTQGASGVPRVSVDVNRQLVLAELEISSKNYQAAKEYALMALRFEPNNARGNFLMAQALRGLGQIEVAQAFYLKSIKNAKEGDNTYIELSKIIGGEMLFKAGKFEALVTFTQAALKVTGPEIILMNQQVRALIKLERLDEATKVFQEIKRTFPEDKYLDSLHAVLLVAQGRSQEALDRIDAFLSREVNKEDVVALGIKARILKDLGRIEDSLKVLEQILDIDPNNIIALSQAGYLYLLTGNPRKALTYLDKAHEREPLNSRVWWNQIQALIELKRIDDLDYQLKRMPDDAKAKRFLRGAVFILKGEYDAAIAVLSDGYPTPTILKLKARAYYLSGRMDLAYQTLKEVMQTVDSVDYFVIAAMIRIERGDAVGNNFEVSPLLKAITESLDRAELQNLLTTKDSNFWELKAEPVVEVSSDIQNSFWSQSGYYSRPVDSGAVNEITHQSHRND